ncbi:MAG: deoxynucleotide monophosphate kinase [Methylomicrobium sp.]|nr:deoxynucleotide monophosphate kinase [Methylomicrobium sp.]
MDYDWEVGLIIGLAGKKQVGKSTAAKVLIDAGFHWFSFADPMKVFARDLLHAIGLSHEVIDYHMTYKEKIIPNLPNVTMRHLLQTLGTDWGRNMIHPDLWVFAASRAVMRSGIGGNGSLVFEDVRFENEASFIREHGGLVIHIVRDANEVDPHASESGIAFADKDPIIINDGSLEQFRLVVLAAAGI